MNKRMVGGLLVVAALGATGAARMHDAGAAVKPRSQTAPMSALCGSGVTFGSGASAVSACISDEGNIVSWSYANGSTNISNATIGDSYQLCSNGNPTYYEDAAAGSGWGGPTLGGSLAAGTFTSTRTTTDGKFKLVQAIAVDKPNQGVIVKASITNLSNVTQSGVQFGRLVDVDADGLSTNAGMKSATEITIAQAGGRGAVLRKGTLPMPATFELAKYSQSSGWESSCASGSNDGNFDAANDLTARLTYTIGNLKPGVSKTLVFHFMGA